jgi:hypothetical protein
MKQILDRLSSEGQRVCVLTPASLGMAYDLVAQERESATYESRLKEIQYVRAQVFLADNAIATSDLDVNGGFASAYDEAGWHFYVVDSTGQVVSSLLGLVHPRTICPQGLKLSELLAEISPNDAIRCELALAIAIEMAGARRVSFGEVACLATLPEYRGTGAATAVMLLIWAFYLALDKSLVVTAITQRHRAAEIVKRLGGHNLMIDNRPLPPIFSQRHDCHMEIVLFDSSKPAPAFAKVIHSLLPLFDVLHCLTTTFREPVSI